MERTRFDHSPVLVIGLLFALGAAEPAQSGPGELDVRFGTHGQTEVPGQVDSAAVIPLPDGRILVFGVPEDPAARNDGAIAVARLLANGEPDAAFGPGGHLNLRISSELPVPTDAVLLADGRILVAGYFRGNEYGFWPDDQRRSRAPGWLIRLSPDALIDPTFGVSGVARIGGSGVDRIALLFDGAIATAAPGLLHRLEPNGTPAAFPGSELSAIPLGIGFRMSAMVSMPDGSLITSAGVSDDWFSWELSRVSASGVAVRNWPASDRALVAFNEVTSFAPDRDPRRLLACGSGDTSRSGEVLEALFVERWQSDGRWDPAFALNTGGRVELGVETRPAFQFRYLRFAACRALLRGSDDHYVVVGDWSNSYEYGGGSILLTRLDTYGAIDAAFDPSRRGRELRIGGPDQSSNWYVADANTASDGAVLLIARRTSELIPNNFYFINELGEQRTLIARVEVGPAQGIGSIGFNDAAVRIAERRHGDLRVYRSGGTAGPISVRYELLHDTADGADVVPTAGTLTWADGDASSRTIPLVPVDDAALEGEERFRVRLSGPTGGAGLGAPEIEVTIEDDEALRALQFAEPALRILEGEAADVVITPPAAARGPIVVRYAVASDLDPDDGSPKPTTSQHVYVYGQQVGELRWSADDTSGRTLRVRAGVRPDSNTIYIALADVSGTLRDGNDWKAARITVVDNPAIPTPAPAPTPAPSTPSSPSGGGGAISLEVLPLLALALLLNFGVRSLAPVNRGQCGERMIENVARRARMRIQARS